MSENERTIFRRKYIGFIFQNYQLLPTLTVEENIAFPIHADGSLTREKNKEVYELMNYVGLKELGRKRACLLSGGKQQRVAMDRDMVKYPIVFITVLTNGHEDINKLSVIHRI